MTMHAPLPQTVRSGLVGALALVLLAGASAFGQTAPRTEDDEKNVSYAVINANDVLVRSGGGDSYYPFGTLKRGQIVKVIGEKYNWARVVTTGPAFSKFFGYLRYKHADVGNFRLEQNEKRVRTLGRAELLAPNMNTKFNPSDSWKRIMLLEPNTVLDRLDTIEDDRFITLKVSLPAKAEGWISTSFLQPATAAEIRAWKEALNRPEGELVRNQGKDEATPGAPTAGTTAPPTEVTMGEKPAASGRPAEATTGDVRPARTADATPARTEPEPTVTPAVARDTPVLKPAPAPRVSPERAAALERFKNLETAYTKLRDEPIHTAEVIPLRDLYLALAADVVEEHETVSRYAAARAEQLEIWNDLQQQRQKLLKLKRRVEVSASETEAMRLAIENAGPHDAVGRLTSSTVYDGVRLPRLYRVQDMDTGRTLAYVKDDDAFDFAAMLDQVVGISGPSERDGSLGVRVMTATRIDLIGVPAPEPDATDEGDGAADDESAG